MSSAVLSKISESVSQRLEAKVSRPRSEGEGSWIVVRREKMLPTRVEHLPVLPDRAFFSQR